MFSKNKCSGNVTKKSSGIISAIMPNKMIPPPIPITAEIADVKNENMIRIIIYI